jgi:hypothetical protein
VRPSSDYVPDDCTSKLVNIRLDYIGSLLAGLSYTLLWRLQSVQNATARMIYRLSPTCRIQDEFPHPTVYEIFMFLFQPR